MAQALRTVRRAATAAAVSTPIRCAIYTRKSTDEGLDRDFNSLDNQREAAEAYIKSQRHEGWEVLPDRYDDGGFSGGNVDRPALQHLLSDIEAGKVDRIVVYKIDRLSRSILDFAKLADFLEKYGTSLVSVTQQLDTATSMGRLTLNMLLSFAQFEREMVSDRTRDKMHAARRRGKWTGGMPPLGYDVVPEGGRLVVNREEAEQVRAIFGLYAENPSLVAISQELNRRGWRRKSWTTKEGRQREGKPWDAANLRRLLNDPIYIGKAKLAGEVFPGEHDAIVPKALFAKIQDLMRENRRTGGAAARNTHGALLRGLLRCSACDAAMVHGWTRRNGRLYRYYVCGKAQKRGWTTCPTKSVPASQIEEFAVDQIRVIGRDAEVRRQTFAASLRQVSDRKKALAREANRIAKETATTTAQVDRLVAAVAKAPGGAGDALMERLSKAQERLSTTDRRLTEIGEQQAALGTIQIDEQALGRVLERFDPIWDVLLTPEKERILRLLIDRVDYDGETETMSFAFRLPGLADLASEMETVESAS
jgi:site-specific DNA recombinase